MLTVTRFLRDWSGGSRVPTGYMPAAGQPYRSAMSYSSMPAHMDNAEANAQYIAPDAEPELAHGGPAMMYACMISSHEDVCSWAFLHSQTAMCLVGQMSVTT